MSRIEGKYGLKTSHAIALFVILLLNIVWFICEVIHFSDHLSSPNFWISALMFVIAVFYACYGYKKPHGNHMRYLLLLYAAFVAAFLVSSGRTMPMYLSIWASIFVPPTTAPRIQKRFITAKAIKRVI